MLTQDNFVNKVNKINPHIKIVSKYTGSKNPIKYICPICNQIKELKRAENLTKKKIYSCHYCFMLKKINDGTENLKQRTITFIKQFKKIKIVDIFKDEKDSKLVFSLVCMDCNHKWISVATNIVRKNHNWKGCPQCWENSEIFREYKIIGLEKSAKNLIEETKIKFLTMLNQEQIIILSEYKHKEKNKLKCLKCNHIWMTYKQNILGGSGCPKCKASKGEKAIGYFLDNKVIDYTIQKTFKGCKYKKLLQFDFYLPKYNLCIEYDGEHHYKPILYGGDKKEAEKKFEETKIKDKIKNEYCTNNNINLLRIPYWEFDIINNILSEYIFRE